MGRYITRRVFGGLAASLAIGAMWGLLHTTQVKPAGRFDCRTSGGYATFTDAPRTGENFAQYCTRKLAAR